MNWIDKLERKFGRFGIQNLTMYIIICYVVRILSDLSEPEPDGNDES